MMQPKALIVLSGGQDSTTCLYIAKQAGFEVQAITFDYGQRHKIELESSRYIGHLAGVESHEFIKLGDDILKSTSPLVSDNELEQYADAGPLKTGIEKRSEEHTSELQSLMRISYAVFCLKKKKTKDTRDTTCRHILIKTT